MNMSSSNQRVQSISLLSKSQGGSHSEQPSLNVGSSRARSSNKIVANSKNAGNQGLTSQASTPWTPERSVLVKSKSQIGKQTIFTGV